MATFIGTNGNDNLTGAHGFQIAHGLGGNDTLSSDSTFLYSELYGGDGNDTLDLTMPDPGSGFADGGAGNDTIFGSGGGDELYGGSGDDSIFGASSSRAIDFVDGGDGNDTIIAGGTVLGGAGNDVINGGGGSDVIHGGDGRDIIDASIGSDDLYGGAGNDLFIADGDNGADRIYGGTGIDTVSYADSLVGLGLDLKTAATSGGSGAAAGDFLRGIENLILTDTGDTVAGDAANNTFTGRGGIDVLNGDAGIDTASYADKTLEVSVTLDGASQVSVFVNDVQEDVIRNIENIIGGTGDDVLGGDGFANYFQGGGGMDSLRTREGNDVLDGGAGADTMNGGPDNDTYFVDNAADVILDSFGTDNVTASVSYVLAASLEIETLRTTNAAGTTAINLTGNELANIVTGNAGANIIKGGAGNDRLNGVSGNDTLTGGLNKDIMTGGSGADDFDFNAVSEMGMGSTRDRITDFTHLTDDIDLSTIDANGGAAGNTAFTFRATEGASFTGVRGQLRWFQQNLAGTDNDRTLIEGDINGDSVADLQIDLTGLKTLTVADFLL